MAGAKFGVDFFTCSISLGVVALTEESLLKLLDKSKDYYGIIMSDKPSSAPGI